MPDIYALTFGRRAYTSGKALLPVLLYIHVHVTKTFDIS